MHMLEDAAYAFVGIAVAASLLTGYCAYKNFKARDPKWKAWGMRFAASIFAWLLGASVYSSTSTINEASAQQTLRATAEQLPESSNNSPLRRFQLCWAKGNSRNECRIQVGDEGFADWLRSRGSSDDVVQMMLSMPVDDNTPYKDTPEGRDFLSRCCASARQ